MKRAIREQADELVKRHLEEYQRAQEEDLHSYTQKSDDSATSRGQEPRTDTISYVERPQGPTYPDRGGLVTLEGKDTHTDWDTGCSSRSYRSQMMGEWSGRYQLQGQTPSSSGGNAGGEGCTAGYQPPGATSTP